MNKKNRFYANRMAIKAISEKEGVDVDIASRMYAQQQGWTGWEKEMDEWNDIQRSYMKSKTKTLADLLSKRGIPMEGKKIPLSVVHPEDEIPESMLDEMTNGKGGR